MKSLLQKTALLALVAASFGFSSARAESAECYDIRDYRMGCKTGYMLTHYGCPATNENLVHCVKTKQVPLAEVRTSHFAWMRGTDTIAVMRNGRVIQTVTAWDRETGEQKPTTVKVLDRLSRRELSELSATVNAIPATTLGEPTGPICYDAPSTSYTVVRASGSVQKIAQWVACMESALDDTGSKQVKELLDGFRRNH